MGRKTLAIGFTRHILSPSTDLTQVVVRFFAHFYPGCTFFAHSWTPSLKDPDFSGKFG
jgi:thiamine transporter ThiT